MDVKRLRQRVVELEEQLSSCLQHQGNEVCTYRLQSRVVTLHVLSVTEHYLHIVFGAWRDLLHCPGCVCSLRAYEMRQTSLGHKLS